MFSQIRCLLAGAAGGFNPSPSAAATAERGSTAAAEQPDKAGGAGA